MKKLWISYAWTDNEEKDVDYIIQELDKIGDIEVKLDRRNLVPGQRLWPQIGGIISDPNECDAWGIVLTSNSILSQPCIEELCYALDRALSINGKEFPIFALLHNVEFKELPSTLKIRLCISLANNDWTTQVKAAIEKKALGFVPENLSNWILKGHQSGNGYTLELYPRFDRISPAMIAVDYDEKEDGNVTRFSIGPSDRIPECDALFNYKELDGKIGDIRVWAWSANNEVSSTQSLYLFYTKKPKRIWFGNPDKLNFVQL